MADDISIPTDLTDTLALRETLLSIVTVIERLKIATAIPVYTQEEVDLKISEAIKEVKKSLQNK